jgi:hypothetical protein
VCMSVCVHKHKSLDKHTETLSYTLAMPVPTSLLARLDPAELSTTTGGPLCVSVCILEGRGCEVAGFKDILEGSSGRERSRITGKRVYGWYVCVCVWFSESIMCGVWGRGNADTLR